MDGDIWDKYYRLKQNPFVVKAVEKGGIVPLTTFYGRTLQIKKLKSHIETNERSLTLIVGDPGVGKTSFVNVVRQKDLTEYFTPRKEIDCQRDFDSSKFMINILDTIYETLDQMENKEKYQTVYDFIKRTGHFNNESGKQLSLQSHSYLKALLEKITKKVKESGFKGIILHFNNLENFVIDDDTKFKNFLMGIRDVLLLDNCHFVFVGNREASDCFNANQKVKTIVTDLMKLPPLSENDIKTIVKKRLEVFRIGDVKYLEPVTEDTIEFLYKLHSGNIREILTALDYAVKNADKIKSLGKQINESMTKTILKKVVEEDSKELTPRTYEVLKYMIKKGNATNSEITKELEIHAQNTSTYIKELLEAGFIGLEKKTGKMKIYVPKNKSLWYTIEPDKGTQYSLNSFG